MPRQLFLIATSALARIDDPHTQCDATRMTSSGPIETILALQNSISQSNCPNQGRMNAICIYIGDKSVDKTPDTDYNFNYQRIVYDAACVDYNNDSDEEIARKVRAMWKLYGDNVRCGPMGVPSTGSPLRYAIHTFFDEFITEAISFWQLDLNVIEYGQTMLDFLDYRIERSTGIVKRNLEVYRRGFIARGAKKRSEL